MRFSQIYAGRTMTPGSWSFETSGTEQLLLVSGSAYTDTENQDMVFYVLVNEERVGELLIHSNGIRTHRAFVPVAIPLRLPPTSGKPHTLTLYHPPSGGSPRVVTDNHDYFCITLIDV